jgi:hypothetical protein
VAGRGQHRNDLLLILETAKIGFADKRRTVMAEMIGTPANPLAVKPEELEEFVASLRIEAGSMAMGQLARLAATRWVTRL